MSYALDLTEGQPRGHAARSCLLGMRIAEEIQLDADERSDLFYALLMKDAGCSSNAARVFQLFGGDDQNAKRGLWERDWRKWGEMIAYALEYTEPEGSPLERLRRLSALAIASSQRKLFEIRCDRGATIARALGLSERTAVAIRAMDEHWDGGGYPKALRRNEIPLYARIVGLAQVVEIYWRRGGVGDALQVVRERRGQWFDPALVKAFCSLRPEDRIWSDLRSEPLSDAIAAAEPTERAILDAPCLSGCFSTPPPVVYGRGAPVVSEEYPRVSTPIRHRRGLSGLLGGVSLAGRFCVSPVRACARLSTENRPPRLTAETLTPARNRCSYAGMSNVLDDEKQQQIRTLGRSQAHS